MAELPTSENPLQRSNRIAPSSPKHRPPRPALLRPGRRARGRDTDRPSENRVVDESVRIGHRRILAPHGRPPIVDPIDTSDDRVKPESSPTLLGS